MNGNIKLDKKHIGIITIILALLTSLSPFAIDTYAPAMSSMSFNFGVELSDIELSMTIYILGYAIGQFLGGPLSDNFGRKPIVIIGLLAFIGSSYMLSLCNSLEYLYLLRFTQALGGGFSVVVTMAIVRDLFSGNSLAKRITYISMFMMTAPLVAPAVGTFLIKYFEWRSIFSFLTIYSILVIALFFLYIPETLKVKNKSRILQRSVKGYLELFSNTKALSLILASAFGFAGMFTFITGSSKIYIDHFNIPVEYFPILFGSNVLLTIILAFVNTRLLRKNDPEQILNVGLIIQLLSGTLLFTVMSYSNPPFILVFILIVIFVGIMGLIFGNANAIVLQLFPDSSGTTMAVIGVIEFAAAALAGFILHLIQDGTIMPFGLTMLTCTIVSNIIYRTLKNKRSTEADLIKSPVVVRK